MKPRERLLHHGAAALSDAELVAILLRTGVSDRTVVDLAQDILDLREGLCGLFDMNVQELMGIRGVGQAKATALAAVMELSRRYFQQKLKRNDSWFQSPEEVFQYLRHHIRHDGSERFCVFFLNPQGSLLKFETMFRGNHSSAPVFVSEIMKEALRLNASDLIVAHNHPSGELTPSPEDRRLTERLKSATNMLDMVLRDHIIFSSESFRSMAEYGDLTS